MDHLFNQLFPILVTGPRFAVEQVCTLYASLKMEGVIHAFFCSGLMRFEVFVFLLEQMRRINVHVNACNQDMLQKQPKMH